MPKMEYKRHFRAQIKHFCAFLQICLLDFYEFLPGDRHFRVSKSDGFGFLRKIHIMLKMAPLRELSILTMYRLWKDCQVFQA